MRFSISEFEMIINYFREKYPSTDQITLSSQVRHLGTVYGNMIYAKTDYVDFASLPLKPRSALAEYLNAHPHLVPAPTVHAPQEQDERDEELVEQPGLS